MSEPVIPRYAIYLKRRMRVLYYYGNNQFMLLDTDDAKRLVHRNKLTFVKG